MILSKIVVIQLTSQIRYTYLFSITNSGNIAATTVSSTIATRWALHSVDDKQSSIEADPPGKKVPRMIPVR
jgi:hypothetical protein